MVNRQVQKLGYLPLELVVLAEPVELLELVELEEQELMSFRACLAFA